MAIEGRLQTRPWEDDHKLRDQKMEIVASSVEMAAASAGVGGGTIQLAAAHGLLTEWP